MARVAIGELVPPVKAMDEDELRGVVGGGLFGSLHMDRLFEKAIRMGAYTAERTGNDFVETVETVFSGW